MHSWAFRKKGQTEEMTVTMMLMMVEMALNEHKLK